MKEERIHELFREMRNEPVPGESLQNVQQAVTEKIRLQRSSARKWRWPLAFATAASIIAIALFWQTLPKTDQQRQIKVVTSIPIPEPATQEVAPLPEVTQVKTNPPRVSFKPVERAVITKPVPQQVEAKKKPDDSIMIRVETEDPNVVILLVGE